MKARKPVEVNENLDNGKGSNEELDDGEKNNR
jgi:hypothetical protein